MADQRAGDPEAIDLVGIGFGPANLALAIAVEEYNERLRGTGRRPLTCRFFERRGTFEWHPGMLLPGATMQVSYLKDLATQRNTASSYTYLSYLADRGRLSDFINLQTFFPLRAEFHDYLSWAAARVDVPVDYGCEISGADWSDGAFTVRTADGRQVRAANLALGGGLRTKLPAGVSTGPRVFHNHEVIDALARLGAPRHGRYVVVGAGQSAAEVAAHLHSVTDAHVHAVFSKFGYTPADDSPFANRVFDAEAVDEFYGAPPQWRDRMMNYHRSTNYSAVDPELITELYRREYAETVAGRRRFHVHRASEVTDVREDADGAHVRIVGGMTGEQDDLTCDAVIFATGFEPASVNELLGPLARRCAEDVHGRPVLDRQYRLSTDPEVTGQIFVQGNSEHSHGLTSTLLSNMAVRSGEIVDALAAHRSLLPTG